MIDSIYILNKSFSTSCFIKNEIMKGKIINIIGDSAEFGPRALGNTSTICLPTKENADYINLCNNRMNEMPMAPILLEKNLDYFFYKEEYLRCLDILKYMIITLKYKKIDLSEYSGVIHNHPTENYFTARPQILFIDQKNHILYETLQLLDDIGIKALINTSFNIHGLKTAFLLDHIINDFYFQKQRDIDKKILLVFITKYINHVPYFYKKINKILTLKKKNVLKNELIIKIF